MKKLLIFYFVTIAFVSMAQITIIPEPKQMSVFEITHVYDASTFTVNGVGKEAKQIAKYFENFILVNAADLNANVKSNSTVEFIEAKLETTNADAYLLEIKNNKITAQGSPRGLFYAAQTLRQILEQTHAVKTKAGNSVWIIPNMRITDQSLYAYRGMHLDVCRHFFTVAEVKKYIDYLARYKFNTFHWHLTEDQGWRIEIKKYPKLTQIGAFRSSTIIGKYPGTGISLKKYGGFYTQEQIKEVVAYATKNYITIIPEIEMPGHSSAALAAYPDLGCDGGPYKVQGTWGVFDEVYCAGNEYTFKFMQDVLDEVCKLFPGKYIHIGGDECPKASWKKCMECQARMQANNLKDENELQSYFIQRIEKYLNKKGKSIIGWDEILEGGLAKNATVMSWRGQEGGIAAAKQKHAAIMTPGEYCYFDHAQTQPEDSLTIGGFTNLKKVFEYNPLPENLKGAEAKQFILGAQGNVWTEYIPNFSKLEYQIFPRMLALSEILWCDYRRARTPKSYPVFYNKVLAEFKYLDASKISHLPKEKLEKE